MHPGSEERERTPTPPLPSASEWNQVVASGLVDGVWARWSHDAECYLVKAGVLSAHGGQRPLGSMPTVCHGGSGYGVGQPVRERQLRRLIRQIRECRIQDARDACQQLLLRRVTHVPRVPCTTFGIDVGICLRLGLRSFFRTPLESRQDAARQQWRSRVHDLSSACKWVNATHPPPWLVKDPRDDTVHAGKAASAECLHSWWGQLLTNRRTSSATVLQQYREASGRAL